MKDKEAFYIGEGIMALINNPLYYEDFTFNDVLEIFQYADNRLCEDFGFMKHDWKYT